jgi:hypothetical protein
MPAMEKSGTVSVVRCLLPSSPSALHRPEIEIALTPDEIEGLDDAGIKQLYEQKVPDHACRMLLLKPCRSTTPLIVVIWSMCCFFYQSQMAEAKAGSKREDFSDMVAARAAQQKRKAQQKADAAKKQKTGADFKF